MTNATAAGSSVLALASLLPGEASATPMVWAHQPYGAVLERMSWLTDVLPSFNGAEQRRALRAAPRRSFEFDVMMSAAERRAAENRLHQWQARRWALPIWPDAQPLSASIAPGATALPCDTATRDFQVGGILAVVLNTRSYEVLQVESLAVDSIGLAAPVARSWPAGSAIVVPLRAARMTDRVDLSRFTGAHSYGRFRFEIDEPCDWPAAVESTYRGIPVLAQAPNWTEDVQQGYERFLARLDPGMGLTYVDDEAGGPHLMQSHRWLLDGRTQADAFRRWLYARRGRLAAFWLPTFAEDFVVAASIGASALTIDVEHCDYTQAIGQAVGRRDIRIRLTTGQTFYRRITGSTVVSSTVERLSIDAALGVLVSPAQVESVSYMAAARLDSDAVEIAWTSGALAESRLMTRVPRNDL